MMKRTTRWMLVLLVGSAIANARAETTATTEAAEISDPVTTTPDGLVSVVASNTPLSRVVAQIDDATSARVIARGHAANAKVPTVVILKKPLKEALVTLTAAVPELLIYQPSDKPDHYEVWDQASYRKEVLPTLARQKVFVLKHLPAEEAGKAIDGVKTPGIGKVAFDPRTNKVFVTDLPAVLELTERLIEQIDVGWAIHVFQVKHADVEDLTDKLDAMKSPAAPELIADRRTRQIIVQDRPEKIAELEKLVEILDVGGSAPTNTSSSLFRSR